MKGRWTPGKIGRSVDPDGSLDVCGAISTGSACRVQVSKAGILPMSEFPMVLVLRQRAESEVSVVTPSDLCLTKV